MPPLLFSYPSRHQQIKHCIEQLRTFCDNQSLADKRINLIGHSLGGLVATEFVRAHHPDFQFHRIVTLGSPLAGSAAAEQLKKYWPIQKIMGPVMHDLSEYKASLPQVESVEFGSIATVIRSKRGIYRTFHEPNDGVVSVEETKLPGLSDHVILRGNHSFLPSFREVIQQTEEFLRTGTFRK